MKKEKIKNIVLIIVVAVISSTITSFATSNYLYDSVDVKYDNSNGVQAETVQGAIDELYSCASDYSTLNNKINGYFKNNPTSYFDGNDLILGKTNTTNNTGLYFYNKNILSGAIYGRHSDNALVITTQSGQTLDIAGDPVKINGEVAKAVKIKEYTINNVNINNRSSDDLYYGGYYTLTGIDANSSVISIMLVNYSGASYIFEPFYIGASESSFRVGFISVKSQTIPWVMIRVAYI